MTVSEMDLELIEASLDGDPEAAAAVAGRAPAEPALADAMADAAAARADRQAFWQAITPTQAQAEQFAWRLRGMIAGQSRAESAVPWWKPGAIVRYGSVAAACIVFGYFAGRTGNTAPGPQKPTVAPAAASSVIVPISDEYGNFVGWQPFKSTEEAKQFEAGLHHALPSPAVPVPVQTVSDDGVRF